MSHVRQIPSCLLAVLAAAIIAGCSDDPEVPPDGDGFGVRATFVGAFVGSEAVGSLSLNVANTQPWALAGRFAGGLLGPIPSGSGPTTIVTGVATFDGISTHQVRGTYNTSTDSIEFTANGYDFRGHFDPYFPGLVGRIVGSHGGLFHCLFGDDSTQAIYCGQWGRAGAPYLGYIGFVTKGNRLTGAMITRLAIAPFLGYAIVGSIDDGDPLRAITARSWNRSDSLAISGSASADTAGGLFENAPGIGTDDDGWWHAVRFHPHGIQTARSSER